MWTWGGGTEFVNVGGKSHGERVEFPDSLVDEALPQSAGPDPEGLQLAEEAVWWEGGIARNAEDSTGESRAVEVTEGQEGSTDDLHSCSHYAL